MKATLAIVELCWVRFW